MFGLGLPEIVIILLVIGVVFFGGKKVTEWSRSLGRASGEFKKGRMEVEQELKEAAKTSTLGNENASASQAGDGMSTSNSSGEGK